MHRPTWKLVRSASWMVGCALLVGGAGVTHASSAAEGTTAPPADTSKEAKPAAEAGGAKAARPGAAPKGASAPAAVDAAGLFVRLGCTVCHGPGARYHERLLKAADKPEQELVRWIRNPEQLRPGTPMPTYASLIDEPTALVLARWLKQGGPAAPARKP